MITHGNKQISEIVYSRKASEGGGAVRLTNIIRGAQVVFGGLYPDVKTWLKVATKAAILAAFGQTDGNAVIKATNAYLNALAATDPTKASALAGFINEDPMMVCSLGLEPQGVQMPIRWLVGDGKSYVDTGLKANSGTYLETKFYGPNNIGARDGEGKNMFMMHTQSNKYYIDLNSTYYNTNITANEIPHILVIDKVKGYLDGVLKISSNITPMTYNLHIMSFNNYGNYAITKGNVSYVIIDNHHFVPFIGQNRDGMIDLVNIEFHLNQGTGHFTDAYTLQDGVTPWTPLNQTP